MLDLLIVATLLGSAEPDADRDGLSDFHEVHKYFTDPQKADTDGDGVPDGDWDERREYAYSVRAVMHVMSPFDVASMNDDYQDVRVLDERPDLLEFEVVVYPFNTVASTISPDARRSGVPAELEPYVAPGPCSNWDAAMQADLRSELKSSGIDRAVLADADFVRRVADWLLGRAAYDDGFTTFAYAFDGAQPRVSAAQRTSVDETLARKGRTLDEQLQRELYGKGMYATKSRGSCTSSAIYLSTALKALGIPTRTVVCVPVVDASDEREVAWIGSRITHGGVREILEEFAAGARGSWTSHTFNEVWIDGRWRRLNYAVLGQNVLDAEYLGLMVHVHTYADHSAAGLVGWGDRATHPQHAALFGGANPYSCVSLSDRFGRHSKVVDDHASRVRELKIERAYWFDDPSRPASVTGRLEDPVTAGHVLVHVETEVLPREMARCYAAVGKEFELRADGRATIPLRATRGYWIDSSGGVCEFYLRIEPPDFARMESGVDYALVHKGEATGARWTVASGVTLRRTVR